MKESTALPTLDELRETTTFTAMAEWLTACPLALFVTHGHEIRAICVEHGFEEAATAIDVVITEAHSVAPLMANVKFVSAFLYLARVMDMPANGASATARPSPCEASSGASGDSRDSARTQS